MTRTYTVRVGRSVRLKFSADFAQASSPIRILEDGDSSPTPYQVADTGHSPVRAAGILCDWLAGQDGEPWGEDEGAELSYRTEDGDEYTFDV